MGTSVLLCHYILSHRAIEALNLWIFELFNPKANQASHG
jgi:hypothetical protein